MKPPWVLWMACATGTACTSVPASSPYPAAPFEQFKVGEGPASSLGETAPEAPDSATWATFYEVRGDRFVQVAHRVLWVRDDSPAAEVTIVLDTLGMVDWVRWQYAPDVTQDQVRADLEQRYGPGRGREVSGDQRAVVWGRGQFVRVLFVDSLAGRVTQWLGRQTPELTDVTAVARRRQMGCLQDLNVAVVVCTTPWRWLYDYY